MDIQIRKEEKRDYQLVESITRKAFYKEKDLLTKGYGCSEHYMVHELRKTDGISDLSLVAEVDGKVVAHIIYSHSHILTNNHKTIPTITFGPVSVKPSYQNQGIGSYLIKSSINIAKQKGYGAIIIYGHPGYYTRFGFVPAYKYNITTKDGDNFDAFMALELIPDYLSNIHGKLIESNIYDEDKHKDHIIEFDKNFKKNSEN